MSLFLTGKNKQQVVSGKINTEKMDFDADQKLSVEFTMSTEHYSSAGIPEIYVNFAGNFKGDRFSGWYMGGFQRSKYDPRFQCSGDFTLVSDEIKEQKAVLSV